MTRIGILSLLSIALVLIVPIHAAASCSQGDLAGPWQVYVFSAYNSGCWTRFNIKINQKGKVTIKSTIDSYGKQSSIVYPSGGQLTVNSACYVTGSIVQPSEVDPISIRVDQGTLNKSKDTFGAVGFDVATIYTCTITGFKR
ncbi:MAG: hypothetical protein ABFD97_06495 [Syntrophobacter sp.]